MQLQRVQKVTHAERYDQTVPTAALAAEMALERKTFVGQNLIYAHEHPLCRTIALLLCVIVLACSTSVGWWVDFV